jgi:hypothetical protein
VQRILITRNTAGQLMLFSQMAYRSVRGTDWSTSAMMMPREPMRAVISLCAEPWCTRTMFQQLQPLTPDPEHVLPSAY